MIEFLGAVARYGFLQNALATGLLASVACGVVGSYVVSRRISYIAGAIAHSVLGGIGLARYLAVTRGWEWLDPLYGAIAAALAAAAIIGAVSLKAREREDTVIGALWAVGMAVGLVLLARTPGYGEDLMGYLFGNILLVSGRDLWTIALLDAVVVGVGLAFYKQLLAVCFDEEFARVRGIHAEFYYLLLLGLTALTVVLLVSVVGIVMVIALITLPAALAGQFTRVLWKMMAGATVLAAAATTLGLAISYGPDLPAGPVIILIAGAAYFVAVGVRAAARSRRGD